MAAILTRRTALIGAAGAGGLLLAGCDNLNRSASFRRVLATAERLNLKSQRFIMGDERLAREYTKADLSPIFKANGSFNPDGDEYRRLRDGGFNDWRLKLYGLVQHPLSLSLAELRALPSTQSCRVIWVREGSARNSASDRLSGCCTRP